MDAQARGLQCGWAGCTEELDGEVEWIKHVSIHVFTLKPEESTPSLGPPELDPERSERHHVPTVDGVLPSSDLHTTQYNTQRVRHRCR